MKQTILFVLALFMLATTADAQKFRFGLKLGTQSDKQSFDDIQIGGSDSLTLGLEGRQIGFHGGVWARFGERLYFQPELVFNTRSSEFEVGNISAGTLIKKEKYSYMDVPLLVGLSIGPLRLHGGPVGHVFLNSTSDLFDIDGYSENFDPLNWGWQAGVGIGRGRFSLDLRYEGNNFKDDHYTFAGQQYASANAPARFIASFNIALK